MGLQYYLVLFITRHSIHWPCSLPGKKALLEINKKAPQHLERPECPGLDSNQHILANAAT